MAQLGFGLNVNKSAYVNGYDQYKTSMFDVLGAEAETQWKFNPLQSFTTLTDLWESRATSVTEGASLVPKSVLNKEYSELGLRFEEDEYQSVVDIMVQAKEDERARQDIINRGPQGILPGLAKLGVGLAVSVADPINLGLGFIPVVGQTRMAQMVAKRGFSQARFARGAAEGAVLATIAEPIVYSAADELQADYGLVDSFLNVTFGSLVGGGLHLGVGKVKDVYSTKQFKKTAEFKKQVRKAKRLRIENPEKAVIEDNLYKKYYNQKSDIMKDLANSDPETRRLLLAKSLDDQLNGRPVDVSQIVEADTQLQKSSDVRQADPRPTEFAETVNKIESSAAKNVNVEPKTVLEVDEEIVSKQLELDAQRKQSPDLNFKEKQSEIEMVNKQLDEIETKSDELDFAIKDAINCINGR